MASFNIVQIILISLLKNIKDYTAPDFFPFQDPMQKRILDITKLHNKKNSTKSPKYVLLSFAIIKYPEPLIC